jgi:hypothetical protein
VVQLARRDEVTEVDGVERAAEDADPSGGAQISGPGRTGSR